MSAAKMLFITPPYHCGVVEVAGHWMPLTFAYLAGEARRAGLEPMIYDAMTKRVGFQEIRDKIVEAAPEYVATSAITSTAQDALEVLRIAKEVSPDIITLIGGVHPSFLYKETLHSGRVDYVIRGEGEETLFELLSALDAGKNLQDVRGIAYKEGHRVTVTRPRPFIQDLDSLHPAWDLVEWKDYRYFVIPGSRLGAVSTSRGCSHSCTFCSQQKFWRQSWRGRKPERVVDEIEHLSRTYGVNVVLFTDEYPTQSQQRWERLLDLLIERDLGVYILMETRAEDILRDRHILRKYREAGVVHIYIGIEATDQETLNLINKDVRVETGIEAIRLIHEHGMITETSFILGFPHETKESIRRTFELSKLYNPDFAHFLALAPWPYADMYEEMSPYIAVHDYRKYNLIDPVIKPGDMSLEEIDKAIIECYQGFYMGKLKEIVSMRNEFKKRYLLRSMKLIMASSFIVDKLASLGKIPPNVKALIGRLEKERYEESADGRRYVSLAKGAILIDGAVEDVFDFVSKPANWPLFIGGLKEVKDVFGEKLGRGTSFRWRYRIRGIEVGGSGTVTDYVENRKLVLQMHNIMPIIKIIHFEENAQGTVLTVEVGHKTPNMVLSLLVNLVKKTLNIMETRTVLERIRVLYEGAETKMKQQGSSSA